jgi:hypothetical protein
LSQPSWTSIAAMLMTRVMGSWDDGDTKENSLSTYHHLRPQARSE